MNITTSYDKSQDLSFLNIKYLKEMPSLFNYLMKQPPQTFSSSFSTIQNFKKKTSLKHLFKKAFLF